MEHRVTLVPGDGTGPRDHRGHMPRARGHRGRVRVGRQTRRCKANPVAQLLSGMLMLRHLDDMKPARDDSTAVGTSEVADALVEKLESEVVA